MISEPSPALSTGFLAGLRVVLSTLLSYLVGAGYIKADNVEGIIGIAVILVTAGYGIWNTVRKQKVIVAQNEIIKEVLP